MKYYKPDSLLTINNAKTIKSLKKGITTYILYMSPHRQNSKGISICPMATTGCIKACLYGSGHGSMSTVQRGRTNKTEFFIADRAKFMETLFVEISMIQLKHKLEKSKFVIRLNGTSDISWESFRFKEGKNIFELFPRVFFYDYTKNFTRFDKFLPKNYRLIFSRSETNEEKAFELLKKGINVAMVFDFPPASYNGYKVINGDVNDLRHLDPYGVIVGLKYKNLTGAGVDNKAAFENGFAIRTSPLSLIINKPMKKAA